MSQSQDDYVLWHKKSPRLKDSHDTEPADPDTPDHSARRGMPLVPDSVKRDHLPEPLRAEKSGAVTVAEAGELYLRVQRSNWENDALTSKYERHKSETYPRILEADRHFQMQFEGLTTAILTRRLSPVDDNGNWLTPWECNEMLHGGGVHRSVRNALSYQLDTFDFEWLAVTAPTRSAGTPHEHIHLWIDDPDDEVMADYLKPALDKHLKYCANAYERHHRYRADGTGEAITVQHDPELIESVPDEFFSITENSQTYAETGTVPPNTAGAQYLASQLAHLPIGDYYNNRRENPPQTLFEGAALAWASPYNWFRAGGGVPS